MNRHLTNDELVDRLYGITGAEYVSREEHLENCSGCSTRFESMRERKALMVESDATSAEVPRGFLAAQRRQIYSRLGENPQAGMKWIPAFAAAACLLVAGMVVYHPANTRTEITDAQLFADVYSMEQTLEPQAAQPIHALFEEEQ